MMSEQTVNQVPVGTLLGFGTSRSIGHYIIRTSGNIFTFLLVGYNEEVRMELDSVIRSHITSMFVLSNDKDKTIGIEFIKENYPEYMTYLLPKKEKPKEKEICRKYNTSFGMGKWIHTPVAFNRYNYA